jgi:hypothetical protein
MNTWAAIAAKPAAVATGLGAGLLPAVAPSAIDGFAVGTLLSGACFLLVSKPGRALRRPRLSAGQAAEPARNDALAAMAPPSLAQPTSLAQSASLAQPPSLAQPASLTSAAMAAPVAASYWTATATVDHLTAEDEVFVPQPSPPADNVAQPETRIGKHRLVGSDGNERRSETRRAAPRHAAPSAGIANRITGKFAMHHVVPAHA